ncbi:hypothetical protein DFA_10631, partial [Cavenderia fasciculata]
FADDHPGGAETIVDVAGQDATNDFVDTGHSEKAVEMLKDLYIGECSDSIKRFSKSYKDEITKSNITPVAPDTTSSSTTTTTKTNESSNSSSSPSPSSPSTSSSSSNSILNYSIIGMIVLIGSIGIYHLLKKK